MVGGWRKIPQSFVCESVRWVALTNPDNKRFETDLRRSQGHSPYNCTIIF